MVNDTSSNKRGPGAPRGFEPRHRGDESHLLREIVRTHQALMAGFSRGMGMPTSRFLLCRLLAAAGDEGAGTMELARQLGVNAAAVTRQLNEMEREGLVRRRGDARDGRRSYVRLSPKGRALFQAIHERAHDVERSIGAALGEEEMRAAAAVLGKLRAFLEGMR
jgi:DNA-binding MarR family transcriptional regulator